MPSLERRYFDSCIFLYVITNKPPERGMNSKAAMQAAEQGRFRLATSMLTMIEVIKDKTGPHTPSPEIQQKIVDFFEHDYVLMVQASRDIMKQARELCWKYGNINLKGVDAVSPQPPSEEEARFKDAMRRILSLTPEQREAVKRKVAEEAKRQKKPVRKKATGVDKMPE